jgi:tellurite resistance protein TehA-like permease
VAFLQTFTAMTVAGLVWMGLFLVLGESRIESLNKIGDWISPTGLVGWLLFGFLCVLCFLLARRILGHTVVPHEDNAGH